ncbi:MAG TPA: hypothetical protein VMZ90_01730 [Vicinamibacterales bacterium]|nr:hypothetical protein [Vicinamibacterales bacterium]
MAGGISGIRAVALLALYASLSLCASAFGVRPWITCVVVFAGFFVWFRVWPHLFTLVVIFGMYGLVLGMPRPEPWPEAVRLVLNDSSKFSLRVLLYLIVPMIFFTSVVDPYQLSRDVARLRIPGAGAVLQLIGSIRLAVFNRLREIDMLLSVRGIESASGLSRFRTVGLWTVPLLAALITEAANRSAYCQMLGLPFPPKLVASRSPLGAIDVALFASAAGLFLLWRFTF